MDVIIVEIYELELHISLLMNKNGFIFRSIEADFNRFCFSFFDRSESFRSYSLSFFFNNAVPLISLVDHMSPVLEK